MPLKGHVGVGGDSQQQGRADVVDARIAGSAAGDRAADKDDVLAVRAVVLLAQIAVGVVAVQNGAILGLVQRVVSDAVAECALVRVAVVADGDVHRAVQCVLRRDVRIAGHRAQLREGVGIGFGTFVNRRCRVRTRHGRAAVERFGRGGRLAVLGDDFSVEVLPSVVPSVPAAYAAGIMLRSMASVSSRDKSLLVMCFIAFLL